MASVTVWFFPVFEAVNLEPDIDLYFPNLDIFWKLTTPRHGNRRDLTHLYKVRICQSDSIEPTKVNRLPGRLEAPYRSTVHKP